MRIIFLTRSRVLFVWKNTETFINNSTIKKKIFVTNFYLNSIISLVFEGKKICMNLAISFHLYKHEIIESEDEYLLFCD